jgi:hypothetical protein
LDAVAADVTGQVLTVNLLHKMCDQSFATYRTANDAAYDAWATKNKNALRDFQYLAESIVLRNAQGDIGLASKVRQYYASQVETLARSRYRDNPAELEKTCHYFPQVLQQSHFDLETKYATELANLRGHPVAAPQPDAK